MVGDPDLTSTSLHAGEADCDAVGIGGGSGLAESPSLVLPNAPTLRCDEFHAQGLAVDPLGLDSGFSASAGLRLLVGD